MENTNKKWFINQLLDAIERAGYKKLNLSLAPRLILISLAKYADKNGWCNPLTSQLENTSGVMATNFHKYFKILESRGFIKVTTKYDKGRKMKRNEYQINLNIILSLSIDEQGELRADDIVIKSGLSNIEQTVPSTSHQTVPSTNKYYPLKATTQEPNLKDIVQDQTLDTKKNPIPFNSDRGFEDFWASYPRKEKKKDAHRIWVKAKLERIADDIITDVRLRQVKHDRWEDRAFIPLPSTYLNGEQWNDEIIEANNGLKGNGHGKETSGERNWRVCSGILNDKRNMESNAGTQLTGEVDFDFIPPFSNNMGR